MGLLSRGSSLGVIGICCHCGFAVVPWRALVVVMRLSDREAENVGECGSLWERDREVENSGALGA